VAITAQQRIAVISAALLALFLGAMDALIVTAAMPTIVSDVGGLHLYSWVYSAYFLSRAVSLPIIGKLADLYQNRHLFVISIALFMVSSLVAGSAWNMMVLIVARVVQGVGAGGIFALVYIVLADISEPSTRGRTLSLASAIWGIASVLGPTLGGFMVTYFSWRWIFFINIPTGAVCIWGIAAYLVEVRARRSDVSLDWAGVVTLSTAILAFLFVFLLGGRSYAWHSPNIVGLCVVAVVGLGAFIAVEKRARSPILSIDFFRKRAFSSGNGAVFMSSFAIFSMFAFAPLFLQGAQGRSPMEVGIAMLSLSLGWSLGSLILGRNVNRLGTKKGALAGAACMVVGCAMTLAFTPHTTTSYSFISFFIIGSGMGFMALSTLLVVQSSLAVQDLGVATSTNQFARTLGGTLGVGICGSFIANRFAGLMETVRQSGVLDSLPATLGESGTDQVERLLGPEVQALLPPHLRIMIQGAIAEGVMTVFWVVTLAAMVCLLVCLFIPGEKRNG
jgi:EmrB/QacA subfamily drug resistance transporter